MKAPAETPFFSTKRNRIFLLLIAVCLLVGSVLALPVDASGADPNWPAFIIGLTVSLLLSAVMLLSDYVVRIRRDLYSHTTLQVGGVAILVIAYMLLYFFMDALVLQRPQYYTIEASYFLLRYGAYYFLFGATPFVVLFGIALSLSNVFLIIREGFRPVNVLGIALSLCMVAGVYLCFSLSDIIRPETMGAHALVVTIQFVIAMVFSLFLAFMLSTMICALIAARRVPECNQDYLVVLGCALRSDGTPSPLLRGRVDRALWFWRKQERETGKRAVFVPSGGQGSDEVISEGESMARYLREQGVPDALIVPETRSANTLQNMAFSKQAIENHMNTVNAANEVSGSGGANAVNVMFATTNYHVFRSGILAKQAGLWASGIGCKAKWYFWPNAFVREFAGLLVSAWKLELVFFGAMALLSSLIAVAS